MKTMSIDCMQYFVAKDGQVTGERSVSSICQLCVRGNPHPLFTCGTLPCIGSPLPMHWVLDLGLRKNPQPLCACCVKSPGIGSPLGHHWVTVAGSAGPLILVSEGILTVVSLCDTSWIGFEIGSCSKSLILTNPLCHL